MGRGLCRPHPSSQNGGTLLAEEVTEAAAHERRLCDPDGYRPERCPRCGHEVLHVHGYRERPSPRTVEAWYYAFKKGGFEALGPRPRRDQGQSRVLTPEAQQERIRCCKREKPRSIRRIIRMLERAHIVRVGELSRSTSPTDPTSAEIWLARIQFPIARGVSPGEDA